MEGSDEGPINLWNTCLHHVADVSSLLLFYMYSRVVSLVRVLYCIYTKTVQKLTVSVTCSNDANSMSSLCLTKKINSKVTGYTRSRSSSGCFSFCCEETGFAKRQFLLLEICNAYFSPKLLLVNGLRSKRISLWRRVNPRNVRPYYPYWQYTDLFIFRFVSLLCLRSTLRLLHTYSFVDFSYWVLRDFNSLSFERTLEIINILTFYNFSISHFALEIFSFNWYTNDDLWRMHGANNICKFYRSRS